MKESSEGVWRDMSDGNTGTDMLTSHKIYSARATTSEDIPGLPWKLRVTSLGECIYVNYYETLKEAQQVFDAYILEKELDK